MVSELHNLVISSIRRGADNQAVSTTRQDENNINSLADSTKEKLTTLFNTTGMRVGQFDSEPQRPEFAKTLDRYLDTDELVINNFRSFGERLGSSLAVELNRGQAQNAKDGFLITYYYSVALQSDDSESDTPEQTYYLGLVFLHRINGVDIDVEDLDLKEIEQINLDSLNLGARINITSFINESDETERPISFKIGRGSEVRKFFQNFIGCNEPSDSKTDSANLILALETICERLEFNADQTKTATDRLQSYCNAAILNGGGQAEITNLAGFVFGENDEQKQAFINVVQDEFQVGEFIGLDKTEINKYDDIIVKTDDYRATIKDSAIMNQTVSWNPEEKSIKLTKLPQEIIDKMNRRFPESEE